MLGRVPTSGAWAILSPLLSTTLYFIVRQKEQVIAGAGNIPSCVAGGISHIVRVLGHGFHDGPQIENSQAQYDYFKAGNSKVAYRHSATGT